MEVVGHAFKLFIYKTQTNCHYQFCAVQNAYNRFIQFHMVTEGNHDLCGGVTELHVLCIYIYIYVVQRLRVNC